MEWIDKYISFHCCNVRMEGRGCLLERFFRFADIDHEEQLVQWIVILIAKGPI